MQPWQRTESGLIVPGYLRFEPMPAPAPPLPRAERRRQLREERKAAKAAPRPLVKLDEARAPDSGLERKELKQFRKLARAIPNETALLKMLAPLADDAARDRFVAAVRPFLTFELSW